MFEQSARRLGEEVGLGGEENQFLFSSYINRCKYIDYLPQFFSISLHLSF